MARSLAFFMALIMVFGLLPTSAFADDSNVSEPIPAAAETPAENPKDDLIDDPTDPVDDPTDPTVDPADPIDDPTDPVNDPTDPVNDPTDPADDPTDPTVDPTDPIDDPTDPADDPTDPTVDPTDPVDDPTDPIDDPTDPMVDPSDPIDDPTDPADDPTDPTVDPVDPIDDPTDPIDDPTDPVNEPIDEPTEPAEDPADEPTEPVAEEPITAGDPTADVENPSIWYYSVASAELTGDWAHDLVEVAKTQLGYTESEKNYILSENGQKKGYTRYGDWYGDGSYLYGEWCAGFVSFCLSYAKVDGVPYSFASGAWVESLTAAGLYRDAAGYTPKAGDLIFFCNTDSSTRIAEHVGIVISVSESGVYTIEGNRSKTVSVFSYAIDDPTIIGYAELPVNPNYAAQTPIETPDGSVTPAEIDEPVEQSEAPAAPALTQQTITDESGRVTVSGILPEGATVTARALTEAEIDALALVGVRVVFAYDITIWVDGAEYQPATPVSVQIAEDGLPEDLTVSHIETNEAGEVTATEVASSVSESDATFTADSFSIYIGTVRVSTDIRLVNGAGYQFYTDAACGTPITSDTLTIEDAYTLYVKANADYTIQSVQVLSAQDGSVSAEATVSASDGVYEIAFAAPTPTSPNLVVYVTLLGSGLITVDLGYQPTAATNDSSIPTLTIPGTSNAMLTQTASFAITGEAVDLGTPQRFGYTFAGWEQDGAAVTMPVHPTESVTYTATWTPKPFGTVTIQLFGSTVPAGSVQISFDSGATWLTFAGADAQFEHLSAVGDGGDTLAFGSDDTIQYGETFDAYVKRILGDSYSFPILQDTRTDAALHMVFDTLATGAGPVSGSTPYSLEAGALSTTGYENLNALQSAVPPITLKDSWKAADHEITTSNNPSDWTWSYTTQDAMGNSITTPLSGTSFSVPRGATVNLQASASSTDYITGWSITSAAGSIYPVEQPYAAGQQYITYTFTMPAANVTAVYRSFATNTTNPVYVDLAQSPIAFAENVTYNGRTFSGFWYEEKMTASTYTGTDGVTITVNAMSPLFGAADPADSSTYADVDEAGNTWYFYPYTASVFYMTSKNAATQNQLKLVNAITVNLQYCNLTPKAEAAADMHGTYIGSTNMQVQNHATLRTPASFADYANILIDLSAHPLYTVTLQVIGENTVGVIANDKLYSDNLHQGQLTMQGSGINASSLTLGTVFTCDNLTVSSLTLHELDDDDWDFLYILYLNTAYNRAQLTLSSAKLDCPDKWLLNGSGMTQILSRTDAEIQGMFTVMIDVSSSALRVHKDIASNIHCLGASFSTIVVDGSILFLSPGNGRGAISNSTVIVKGEVCDILGCSISGNSLVVCNVFCCATGLTVSGGTLVTNLITGKVFDYTWDTASLGYSVTRFASVTDQNNGDDYPFFASREDSNDNATSTNKYIFSGGNVYLLGGYTFSDKRLDPARAIAATGSANNAVGEIMQGLLDADGNYNGVPPTHNDLLARVQGNRSAFSHQECIHVGTTRTPSSASRIVKVTVSGGEIHAAGNITFMNDTTVSGGVIDCGGTFSTKQALTVTGGTINAAEIGTLCAVELTENQTKSWQPASFANCSLTTDRIGALSAPWPDTRNAEQTITARSTVSFGEGVSITARSAAAPIIVSDIHMNYFGGEMTAPDTNPVTLRFTQNAVVGSDFTLTAMALCDDALALSSAAVSLALPASGTETGVWHFANANGYEVTEIDITGDIIGAAGAQMDKAWLQPQISLYAVKTKYTLTVHPDDGVGYTIYDVNAGAALTGSENVYSVTAGHTLRVTPSDLSMADKTVAWYRDAAGLLHNVDAFAVSGGDVTFTMPYNATDVYITNELKLYLDWHNISFTDDGFAVELASNTRRNDSVFTYAGNFCITQENTAATNNRYVFETQTSGNVTRGVSVRLYRVNQTTDDTHYGGYIADSASVELTVDGANTLCSINVPEQAFFTLKGKNGTGDSVTLKTTSSYYGLVSAEPLGTVTIQDLTLGVSDKLIFRSRTNISNNVQTLRNVTVSNATIGTQGVIASGCRTVVIEASHLSYTVNWSGSLVGDHCTSLTVKDGSEITLQIGNYPIGGGGGNTSSNDLFQMASGGVAHIQDSTVTYITRQSESDKYGEQFSNGNVYLEGTAQLTVPHRIKFNSLHLSDDAKLTVGSSGVPGYVFAADVTVEDSAEIETDYLFVAGYSTDAPVSTDTLIANMNAGTYIRNGSSYGGLVLNGGTVTAREFVGGDVNGKITVNGGTLTASKIGTLGQYCGFSQELPPTSAEQIFAYFTDDIPVGATVTVNEGGTVNVTENGYLGGMNARVNISGGTVNLANGALLGMTDAHATTLKNHYSAAGGSIADHTDTNCTVSISGGKVEGVGTGSISTPYGAVNVAGAHTLIKAETLKAENGTISIAEAGKGIANEDPKLGSPTEGDGFTYYTNLYTISDRYHKEVAVQVNELTAQSINISDGAVVYAASALANVEPGTAGGLVVQKEADGALARAYLYTTGSYGATGSGTITNDYYTAKNEQDNADQKRNVFGTQVININYHLNPYNPYTAREEILQNDLGAIINNNIAFYEVSTEGGTVQQTLSDATCPGYTFQGWYTDASLRNPIPAISLTGRPANGVLELYAKWERVKVPFEIHITLTDAAEATSAMTQVGSTNEYCFNTLAYGEYGSPLLGASAVYLDSYMTKTSVVSQVELADNSYNGGAVLPIDANTYVTLAIVEAYQTKNAPLILRQAKNVNRTIPITFVMNLSAEGYPIETGRSFHNNKNATTQTATEARSDVDINGTLIDGTGFADASSNTQLMQPVAPGYTFGGWYTDAACTGTQVNATTTIFSLQTAGTTTLYAKWTANDYVVRFYVGESMTENTWVLPATHRPAQQGAGAGNLPRQTLDYTWTYDRLLTDDGAAKTKDTVTYKTEESGSAASYTVAANTAITTLPVAWREGYIFRGWQYTDAENATQLIAWDAETKTFSGTLPALNVSNFALTVDANGFPSGNPVYTLTAAWQKATVTYALTDGAWASSAPTTEPAYGDALAGYIIGAAPANGELVVSSNPNYAGSATYTNEYGTAYNVVSTTASYYASNGYITEDFRNSIVRKGYTFAGWRDADGNLWGGAPRFESVTVHDTWLANSYNLNLYGQATPASGREYTSAFSDKAIASDGFGDVVDISVTVGQAIPTSAAWPAREGNAADLWYAINDMSLDSTNMRYLLGVTFAPMDPGTSLVSEDDTWGENRTGKVEYEHYAQAITNMYASGTLYDKGETFFLPKDASYRADIGSAAVVTGDVSAFTVPDYPAGSTIKMYGVYRERSLVLIERYVDDSGEHRAIKYSGPWMEWIDPSSYVKTVVEDLGYTFKGWYVNTKDLVTNKAYPAGKAAYEANSNAYKTEATTLGTYDIMVYTVYVPQAKTTLTLTANADPAETPDTTPITETYQLPGSMQSGYIGFTRGELPDGFYLAPVDDFLDHLTDSEYSIGETTYTADNAVAITMTIEKTDGSNPTTYDLSMITGSDTTWYAQSVDIGDKITLRLYHSSVMTQEALHTLTSATDALLHFGFDSNSDHTDAENTLAEQTIEMTVEVQMVASLYTVTYTATLPETVDQLTVVKENGFTMPTGADLAAVKEVTRDEDHKVVAYGTQDSTTVYPAPEIEGYTFGDAWTVSVPTVRNNTLTASGSYTPIEYKLTADADTLQHWTVTYTDGLNATSASSLTGTTGADVKYHSTVTFAPQTGVTTYPEFITLTMKEKGTETVAETHTLLEYIASGETDAVLRMPAYDISITYSETKTLYLDNGSILLTENGYKQKNGASDTRSWDDIPETVWHGDYTILQNSDDSTAAENTTTNPGWVNTLTIQGNQTKRSNTDTTVRGITFGNLKITSDDSIAMWAEAKANVTVNGSITANNVLVPATAEVSITYGLDDDTKAAMVLTPAAGSAAIGGKNAANGKITLKKLAVQMTVPAGSTASGIGPGVQTATDCGDISLTNCAVEAAIEGAGTVLYSGAWIGGAGVGTTTLEDVTVTTALTQAENAPAKVVDGTNVTIKDSSIGTADKPIYDAVHAATSMTVDNSDIYLGKYYNSTMIGTDAAGFINVNNASTISVAQRGGDIAELYTGTMKIFDAASDVNITGTQVVEVSNGAMTLNSDSMTQGSSTHSHTGMSYLLLEELNATDKPGKTANALTVSSIGSDRTITVKQPHTGSANTAVTVASMTVDADAAIALKGELTVNGTTMIADGKTLTVNGKADGTTDRTLTLTGGFADTTGSYVQTDGSLVRTNADLAVGGDMTLTDVTANVGTGKLGSTGKASGSNMATTVSLNSGNTITAAAIGALGDQLFYTNAEGTAANGTFTKVVQSGENTLGGILVQDLYRLTYDRANLALDVTGLPASVRMKTENGTKTYFAAKGSDIAGSANGLIPDAPAHSAAVPFTCWYINTTDGRISLTTEAMPGLDGHAWLVDNTTASDQTGTDIRTIPVHAWAFTGTATIKKDRQFRTFTDGANTAVIQQNQAWTVQLTVQGALTSSRDYTVTFGTVLPAGTDLTLVHVEGSTYTYYYYRVTSETTSVNFKSFKQMGIDTPLAFGTEILTQETFLLSADFSEQNAAAASTGISVAFAITPSASDTPINLAETSYTVTSVTQGAITAASGTINISTAPAGDEDLAGKHVYLIGVLDRAVGNGAVAVLAQDATSINGEWIAGDTVAFDLGAYGSISTGNRTAALTTMIGGVYTANWCLYAGEASTAANCLRAPVSNSASDSIAATAKTLPSLAVNSPSEHVFAMGSAHTLDFTFTKNEMVETVQITVEKENALGAFIGTTGSITITPASDYSSASIVLAEELGVGTYRIRFSINETDSKNDDVYYSFIVE